MEQVQEELKETCEIEKNIYETTQKLESIKSENKRYIYIHQSGVCLPSLKNAWDLVYAFLNTREIRVI